LILHVPAFTEHVARRRVERLVSKAHTPSPVEDQ
jgi:hypothetical protein